MLVLGRKRLESIMISDNFVVTILEIRRNKVRIGIDAPKEIPVLRTELRNRILDLPTYIASETDTPDIRAPLKEEEQSCN
jgi:carbon storage regulator